MSALVVQVGQYKPLALARDRLSRRCAREFEQRGLPWQPLACDHGLDLAGPETRDSWVLARHQHAFVRDAERLAGDPFLGWSLGAWDLRDLGLYGYSLLNAPNLRSALRLMVELSSLETEAAQFALYVQADKATLAQTWSPSPAMRAAWLHMFLSTLRHLVGPAFKPLRLGLGESDPERLQGLSERAGVDVEGLETPITFVTFARHLLDCPITGAEPELADILTRLWLMERDDLVARQAEMAALADAIVPLLAGGTPCATSVACALGITTDELQRKLGRSGGSLPDIVDAVRSGLSIPLLTEPNMTLIRATKALGFTYPDEFVQAHRRWWQTAPQDGRGRPLPDT